MPASVNLSKSSVSGYDGRVHIAAERHGVTTSDEWCCCSRLKRLGTRDASAAESLDGFELFYSVPRAASFAISIRLGRPVRQQMLPTFVSVQNVIEDFLESVDQFNNGKGDDLRHHLDSDAYFNNFRALAKKLAPDGQKISNVGFTSIRGDERCEASLSHPADPSIHRIEDESTVVRLVGEIHKADELRRGTPIFGILDDKGEVHQISVPAGLLNDIVKPYWGERVAVVARQTSSKLELVDLEPVAENEGDKERNSND